MDFDANRVKEDIVKWIREWFEENGKGCNAVIGISGGKDSSIAAALCVEALGKDRVIGVLMPNGVQHDIDMAQKLVEYLQIESIMVNIKDTYDVLYGEIEKEIGSLSEQTCVNMPARIRMVALYAVSQTRNGRVVNTCNLSEDWVGYATRYGDGAGDFAPIAQLTVTEIKEIGRVLGLPIDLVDKVPLDGLSDKTDEDNLGFSYDVLDQYIRYGIEPEEHKKKRIDTLHKQNLFKLEPMPSFPYKQGSLTEEERKLI